MAFFGNAARLRDETGCISLTKVRQELSTLAVTRRSNVAEAGQEGRFLSLSRWKGLGCTDEELERIQAHGQCRQHPVWGETFCVPDDFAKTASLVEKVREEAAAVILRPRKRKAALLDKPDADKENKDSVEEALALLSQNEDEDNGAAGDLSKLTPKQLEKKLTQEKNKADKKRLREELKARQAETRKVYALAQKACKGLQSLTVQLENGLKRKNVTSLATQVLTARQTKVADWKQKASQSVALYLKDNRCLLSPLPFTEKELKDEVGDTAQLLKDLKQGKSLAPHAPEEPAE